MKWLKRLLGRRECTTYTWQTTPAHAARIRAELATRQQIAAKQRLANCLHITPSSDTIYASFVKVGNFIKDERDAKFLGALGMSDEAGEVAGIIKKHLLHGKPLDRDHLVEELGDTYWYLVHTCNTFGISIDEVRGANVAKLCKRYPDQYGDVSDWLNSEGENET